MVTDIWNRTRWNSWCMPRGAGLGAASASVATAHPFQNTPFHLSSSTLPNLQLKPYVFQCFFLSPFHHLTYTLGSLVQNVPWLMAMTSCR